MAKKKAAKKATPAKGKLGSRPPKQLGKPGVQQGPAGRASDD